MVINFNTLKFRPSLFEAEAPIKDFNKQLANAIWQNRDIAAGKFALALFDNPEQEVGETEAKYIREAIGGFLQWAQMPVLDALEEI